MAKRSIVLIDDNAIELKLCQAALKGANLQRPVISFSDSEEAYQYIRKRAHEIFIIICDIKMPRMTGLEILEKINENSMFKMQAIPFVFLSNSEVERDIVMAYTLAAQGYFVKPLDMSDLENVFKAIIAYWSISKVPYKMMHIASDGTG